MLPRKSFFGRIVLISTLAVFAPFCATCGGDDDPSTSSGLADGGDIVDDDDNNNDTAADDDDDTAIDDDDNATDDDDDDAYTPGDCSQGDIDAFWAGGSGDDAITLFCNASGTKYCYTTTVFEYAPCGWKNSGCNDILEVDTTEWITCGFCVTDDDCHGPGYGKFSDDAACTLDMGDGVKFCEEPN